MKLTKGPPRKKAKVEGTPFKPPSKAEVVEISDASQQQDDSQTLSQIKPNGSKVDAKLSRVDETPSMSLESDSENSADAQDEMRFEEERMYAFRSEAKSWLADHGKAFFHVEFLQFARDQEKKRGKEPLSEQPPPTRRMNVSRFK